MGHTPFSLRAVGTALGTPVDRVEELARFEASEAEVARLRLNSPGGAGTTVIAKYATGAGAAAARREIRFFEQLASQWDHPAPQLLGATDAGDDVLLLTEDLEAAGYRVVGTDVSETQLQGAVDILAGLHAHFWDDVPAYLTEPGEPSVTCTAQAWSPEVITRNATAVRREASEFLATTRELEDGERAVLGELIDRWERQFQTRVADGRSITLIHGDFHFLGNVFFSADDPRPKVIDWSELKPGLGPHDLAYCLSVVPTGDRLARDRELLRRYWEALRAAGLDDYSWELCEWDFRFSVISNLFQSVFQRSVRWYRMSLAAIDALDARATLIEKPPI
ncbi:aminoglycoside phosphotransferase family protein [Kribbella capetownensis]|uniref:Aminoglycoside phosphotransferase family protein n=1 Tax=Kribbella capetownensis TaxID=1572659 RepID=A0A4R0JFE1_9ACTN|nr:aminoglycoside phosphotransferase family protein [Kribbella capetownensis]TCC44304.1 aminoglycoside phosphotransferase family protein [Kribbella capetownensis]